MKAITTYQGRPLWRGHKLNYVRPEPLLWSLLKYRQKDDREQVDDFTNANLISSRTVNGKHLPVLDLDFPHEYKPSTKPGHGHLYLNVEIPTWRWAILMVALRMAGATELGFAAWSLRRGANYVRPPWISKTPDEELRSEAVPVYGWIRKRYPNKKRIPK